MLKNYILCFVVLVNVTYVLSGIFTRGNSQITIEFIKPCADSHPRNDLVLNWERCNKTHRCVRGWFYLHETTDKDYMAEVKASKWGDGGWKDNAFQWKLPDACNSLGKIMGKNWKAVTQNFGENGCPFHEGRHNITDFYVDLSDIPVAVMYGKYNLRLNILKFDELIICQDFVLNVG